MVHCIRHSSTPAVPRIFLACLLVACGLTTLAVRAAEAPWVGETLDGLECSGGGTGYGPYDYTHHVDRRRRLPIVERHHFTPKVASLQGGESGALLPDIDYTLRAFPNHHAALFSIIRLYTRTPRDPGVDNWRTPPECYLQRALHFAPRDSGAYLLYGIYLHRKGRLEQAEAMYRKSLELDPDSAEAHYNLGLLLLDRNEYEAARAEARSAYAKGYPLPGLRSRLTSAGYPP